jgi:hypothetical protein
VMREARSFLRDHVTMAEAGTRVLKGMTLI